MPTPATIDANIPRFNQAVVAVLTAFAFVAQLRWPVAIAFGLLAVSRFGGPRWAPLTRLYTSVIRPRLRRRPEVEDARPPRFAQLVGTAMLGTATAAFVVGADTFAWVLVVIVASLAALAATARICVGCLLYTRFAAGADA